MSGLFGSTASNANPAQGELSKDIQVADGPTDSISDLAFSPADEGFLAVASWDNKMRIYEVQGNGQTAGKAMIEHQGPVLSCCWARDGKSVFSAGADKTCRMMDVSTGQTRPVAMHDSPIRSIKAMDAGGSPMVITGSWDKTVKYWDTRTDRPAATLQCQERVYAMDVKDKLLVIGTADRWINIVNLDKPTEFYKSIQSPLKWQTRTVSCFSDATGFAVGSIEGRCAIQYVEDKDSGSNFSFKCHRQTAPNQRDVSNVYSVNAISFHPVHGTFSTAGSDGTFHFWDKDAKHRLKGYPEVGQTISATAFSKSGQAFAYACSYDWSKGFSSHTPQSINKVMLHPVQGDECKPRAKPAGRR